MGNMDQQRVTTTDGKEYFLQVNEWGFSASRDHVICWEPSMTAAASYFFQNDNSAG